MIFSDPKDILVSGIYLLGIIVSLLAITGRPRWALLFIIALFPLRNIVDKLQTMPLGQHWDKILFITILIGFLFEVSSKKVKISSPKFFNLSCLFLVFYTFFSLIKGSVYLGSLHLFDISDSRVQTWKNFCELPLLYFLSLNLFRDHKWIARVIVVTCLVMAYMTQYLFADISWYSDLASRDKIRGTFSYLGPNEVAAFFNQYAVLLIGLFLFIRKKWLKFLLLALIVGNIYVVLFLYSRGAYMGFLVGLLGIALLRKRSWIIPLVLILFFWQAILPQQVQERILMTTDEFGDLDPSALNRVTVWKKSMDVFGSNPIFGVGFGVFRELGFELGDTHNIYVKILVEQGVVGIFIFILLITALFVQGLRLYRDGDDWAKGLGLGFVCCLLVMLVNNIFGDRWTYAEVSSNLWVFAALVTRLNLMKNECPVESENSRTPLKKGIGKLPKVGIRKR